MEASSGAPRWVRPRPGLVPLRSKTPEPMLGVDDGSETAGSAGSGPPQTPESAPFNAGARNLDLVTVLFSHHELLDRERDRLAFNRAVFAALAPVCLYVEAAQLSTSTAASGGAAQSQYLLKFRRPQ